jgi:hypothetical protein
MYEITFKSKNKIKKCRADSIKDFIKKVGYENYDCEIIGIRQVKGGEQNANKA